MDIKEFFEQCAGKWFSQRTNYQLIGTEVDNSKSDLTVEILPSDDPSVVSVSQACTIPSEQIWGGLKMSWDNSADWGKPKQVGSALMVIIPDADQVNSGQLLRAAQAATSISQGHYSLANDTLTLTIEDGTTQAEERIWFASPNLRLRTSSVKEGTTFIQTGFYSEIRRMPPKEES